MRRSGGGVTSVHYSHQWRDAMRYPLFSPFGDHKGWSYHSTKSVKPGPPGRRSTGKLVSPRAASDKTKPAATARAAPQGHVAAEQEKNSGPAGGLVGAARAVKAT